MEFCEVTHGCHDGGGWPLVRLVILGLVVGLLAGCGGDGSGPDDSAGVRVMAAGDLVCEPDAELPERSCREEAVSRLVVDADPDAFLALGDLCYEEASAECFAEGYDATFGRVKEKTIPAVGNHEYSEDPAAYFDYFGPLAGDPERGYYSKNVGDWHVLVLNSMCDAVGGCEAGDPQEQWLREDLAADKSLCTLAIWHHPLFSSGDHGSQPEMKALWEALMDDRAELGPRRPRPPLRTLRGPRRRGGARFRGPAFLRGGQRRAEPL